MFAAFTSVVSQFSNDLLIFAIVAQLEVHFHILAQSLLQYEIKTTRSDMKKNKALDMDLQYLKGIIQYHNLVLE